MVERWYPSEDPTRQRVSWEWAAPSCGNSYLNRAGAKIFRVKRFQEAFRKNPAIALAVLAVVTLAAALFHLYAVNLLMPRAYSDLTPRIVGTRDALDGVNPYSAHALHDIQRTIYGHVLTSASKDDPQYFSYPALIIPLLIPVTQIPIAATSFLFLAVMLPALAASFWWWTRNLVPDITPKLAACVVILCLSSWPVVWGLRLQQPTDVAFVLITVALAAVRSRHDWIAGVAFAVAIIKPQIVLPLLLWLGVWFLRKRRFGIFPAFAATLGALWLSADRCRERCST